MMKRHDLAIFAMAAIAIPASVNAAESGVAGSVHVFPACLAPQAQDQGCVKRYSEARVEVRDATGALVQFANADTDGNFRVPLPPGSIRLPSKRRAACGRAVNRSPPWCATA